MKGIIVFGAMGVGFLLLVLSFVWSKTFLATSTWTNEKEAERAAVQDRIHNLRYALQASPDQSRFHSHAPLEEANGPSGRRDPVMLAAELDELMEESDRLNAEFQSARDRPHAIASILKWTGVTLVGLGVVGYFAVREA